MQVLNTQEDYDDVANIVIMVYGMGGMGKTTFASTFPKPLLLDFENGAKYFKQRGINIDVVRMDKWFTNDDKRSLTQLINDYETIVVDPIGEMMDKLIQSENISGSKYRQSDGSLTMAGWGKVKEEARAMIKWMRDTGKNVVIVAHVDEKQDEEAMIKRPLVATKFSDELIAMVDIVGYLDVVTIEGEDKRVLRVKSGDKRYIGKDRTGTLDAFVKPEYEYIHSQIKQRQTPPQKPKKAPKKKKEAKPKVDTKKEVNPFEKSK